MIDLDWTLFVQMAIFLAFMVYLNAFLLKPLSAYVARRKETIEGLRDSGGEQDAALEAIQKDYTHKLNEAHDEMLAQRTAARKEADQQRCTSTRHGHLPSRDGVSRPSTIHQKYSDSLTSPSLGGEIRRQRRGPNDAPRTPEPLLALRRFDRPRRRLGLCGLPHVERKVDPEGRALA